MKKTVLKTFIFFILGLSMNAQNTWTGNGDGISYTDPNNWIEILVPTFGSEDIPSGLTITIPAGETVQWPSGLLKGGGTINILGTLEFTDGNKYIIDSTQLINNGTVKHDDGVLYIQTGKVINNSIYTFSSDAKHIRFTAGTQHDFINHGIIEKTGGTSFNIIQVKLENDGSIRCETGELRLESTGVYNDGTILETLPDGFVTFQSGEHSFYGTIGGSSLGTILMKASINVFTSATFDFSDNGVQCSTCSFGGGGDFIFNNTLYFSTTTIKYLYDSTTVIVHDSVYLNEGSIYIQDGHLINNGVLVINGDNNNISFSAGNQHLFTNHGLIVKSSGSSHSFINASFHNYGTIEVLFGELRTRFDALYFDGTTVNTAAGSIFSFHDGSHLFSNQISGHSEGQIILKSNLFVNNQAIFDITGNGVECSDCSFNGGGEFIWNDKFTFSSDQIRLVNDSTTLTNNDSMIFTGGSLYINTGKLISNGLLEFTGDNQNITFNAGTQHDFLNSVSGRVIKTAGTGNIRINANTINNGSVFVASGKISFEERLSSTDRPTYGGNGTIDVQSVYTTGVYNSIISPGINGVGYLDFIGNCSQCTLVIDIDSLGMGGVNFDFVNFKPYDATLAEFNVNLNTYIPPLNHEFYVASALQMAVEGLCPGDNCFTLPSCSSRGFRDHRDYTELNNQYYHFLGSAVHQDPPFTDFAIIELFDITSNKLEVTKETNSGLPGEFVVITETAKGRRYNLF